MRSFGQRDHLGISTSEMGFRAADAKGGRFVRCRRAPRPSLKKPETTPNSRDRPSLYRPAHLRFSIIDGIGIKKNQKSIKKNRINIKVKSESKNKYSLIGLFCCSPGLVVCGSSGNVVPWSSGPLVLWSPGPLVL